MKATSGVHFIALDHVRALAAFLVFAWHFMHGATGYPVAFAFLPPVALAPLAVIDEGHTGVALFMTLSGYLFAKLLDGKAIVYRTFIWNRALRILPLLGCICIYYGVQDRRQGGSSLLYLRHLLDGIVLPVLPNGGWSLTIEFHFYLLLPLLLWLLRKASTALLTVAILAMLARCAVFLVQGDVQWIAYWTIFGRIDQFVLGILGFHHRDVFKDRHLPVALMLAGFSLFYWTFDRSGGFYGIDSKASDRAVWIFMPTVEGAFYAACIAWYEQSFSLTGPVSNLVGIVGTCSYSIYLLHFFWVFDASRFVADHFMHLDNFYVALAWSALCYLLMVPVAYLSYRYVESPFLRLRRPYIWRMPPQ